MLDMKICDSINSLLEKLTTTGKDILDTALLKELLIKAGTSEEYLKFSHQKILQQLEKNHSEIRYGTVLVVEHLFKRSKFYRQLLLMDFDTFLELTVETNFDKLLPKPFSVAKRLKTKTLQLVQYWNSEFSLESSKISMAYVFLKTRMKVDFEDALKRSTIEVDLARRNEERQRKINQSRIEALKTEVNENIEEISRVITEMDNCFSLLIPKPDNFFGSYEQQEETDLKSTEQNEGVDLREHGIVTGSSDVTITLSNNMVTTVQFTDDNQILFEKLKETYLVLKTRFLPKAKGWIKVITKSDDTGFFKRLLDLKEMIQREINRYEELRIEPGKVDGEEDTSETDDSDFEEVPPLKEDFEEFANMEPVKPSKFQVNESRHLQLQKVPESSSWSLWGNCANDPEDPTTFGATMKKPKQNCTSAESGNPKPGTSKSALAEEKELTRKERLLQQAPKVPYDIDLFHWEDENLMAPSIELVESDSHRFWQPSDREGEVIEAADGVAALRTRTIQFTGKFEPVAWTCRVPLSSGKFCPRKDRIKCPFHGKIIERDEYGIPVNPGDVAAEEKRVEDRGNGLPEWQDPSFLKDLQAQIGIDLTIKPCKKGSRKNKTFTEKYPGLTDIEKEKKTSRVRLAKKVLAKNSLKRVGQALDDIAHKNYKDKFGDQFNYAYNE